MKLILKLVFFLLTGFVVLNASAQRPSDTLDNVVVADLTEDWLYYDDRFKSFLPYLKQSAEPVNSVDQLLDLNKYESYNLNFVAAPGLSFFVDNKLCFKNNSSDLQNVRLRIGDLVGDTKMEKELITFYHPEGNLPIKYFFIGHSVSPSIADSLAGPSIILSRQITDQQNVFVVFFLAILIMIALIRNRYPKKFNEFFRFNNVLPSMDDDVLYDLSSVPVLMLIMINSLCSALVLFLVFDQFDLKTLAFMNIFRSNPVVGIVTVGTGFFLVFLLKYIYLKILGWIFNLTGLVKVQFFELMKVSLKINLFLAVLSMVFYCSSYFHVQFDFDYFFYFTIVSLLIVLIRVGYLSFKLSGFRNIYLFSYLCTTEILPLVIIIKLILF